MPRWNTPTVALLSPRDSSLVTGTVTNPQGQFLLEPVPAGTYRVRITYIGYRNAVKENLVVRPDAPVVDLGSIRSGLPRRRWKKWW
jgi:hypothetical protein